MESENREAKSNARDKTLTRLQKCAPPALRLDQITTNASNNYPSSNESNAIPLLSPLILSPLTMQEEEGEEKLFMESNDEKESNTNNNLTFTVPQQSFNGWQHPAVEALPDASSLFTFFQSQCVLVNRVQ
ncbi:hypothetical protein ACSBR2_032748 [Camellia fascicularis]